MTRKHLGPVGSPTKSANILFAEPKVLSRRGSGIKCFPGKKYQNGAGPQHIGLEDINLSSGGSGGDTIQNNWPKILASKQ